MDQSAVRVQEVGRCNPSWGELRGVVTNADHTSYVILTEPLTQHSQGLVFRDRVIEEFGSGALRFALSYDGARLAWIRRNQANGTQQIIVNDEVIHTSTAEICDLVWLDKNRLAWSDFGEPREKSSGHPSMRFFIDGVEQGDDFGFEQTLSSGGREHFVHVLQGDAVYTVLPNGEAGSPWKIQWDERFGVPQHRPSMLEVLSHGRPRVDRERAQKVSSADRCSQQLVYRGIAGPAFQEISHECYGASGAKVGYSGEVPNWVMRTYAAVGSRLSDRFAAEVASEPTKQPSLAYRVFAFLANPYFGPFYLLAESARRYQVVDNHIPWEKLYSAVYDLEYAPSGKLVAQVADRGASLMVVDSREHPAFEAIHNWRLHADGRLTYLASKGDTFYRVESLV